MASEPCGSTDTTTGEPCQFTPGSSCPHHDNSNAGRPLKLDDPSRRDDLIEAAKEGMSKSGCCRAAGVTIETLNDYLERAKEEDADDRFIEFFDRFKRARSEGEKQLVHEARANGDAKFLLATSFGYSKKQEIEHSGEIDAGVMRVQEPATEDEWEEEHGSS